MAGVDAAEVVGGDVDEPFDAAAAGEEEAVDGASAAGCGVFGGDGADAAVEAAANNLYAVAGEEGYVACGTQVGAGHEQVDCGLVDIHLGGGNDGVDGAAVGAGGVAPHQVAGTAHDGGDVDAAAADEE